MLDQTFSYRNFQIVYTRESRIGNIPKDSLGEGYVRTLKELQANREQLHTLKKKKRAEWTDEEAILSDQLREKEKNLLKQRQEELTLYVRKLAELVNSKDFRFKLATITIGDKTGYRLDAEKKDYTQFFAMKQLQYNLQRTFKVKQANRHLIMSNLKLLLTTRRPFYLIRADVSSFFESIPHSQLLPMIMDNTLLSHKSKMFIKAILNEYERVKVKADETTTDACGLPRGVAISSLLLEIYMRDLDNKIKHRMEVTYYARYVDDIVIILSDIPDCSSIEQYYRDLSKRFSEYGLTLKDLTTEKGIAIDFTQSLPEASVFTYLGYEIRISKIGEKKSKGIEASYSMSHHKIDRIHKRIDNAFSRFDRMSKHNVHVARRGLIDALKLIVGNIKLQNAKSRVKVGIYYNNDLLDNMENLRNLNDYLWSREVHPYEKLFKNKGEREAFIGKLKTRIQKFDFKKAWEERKIYDISSKRVRQIMKWLNYEKEEA